MRLRYSAYVRLKRIPKMSLWCNTHGRNDNGLLDCIAAEHSRNAGLFLCAHARWRARAWPICHTRLRFAARCPLGVNSDGLVPLATLPLYPPTADMSADIVMRRCGP